MKVLIATPLYPPEIGGPATYVKELCAHLSGKHQITIVAFTTDHPEIFPGTKLISVSKRQPILIRHLKYILEVWRCSQSADLIYAQNAVASGFPAALVSIITGIPLIVKFVGDESWERATQLRQTKKRLDDFLNNPEGSLKIKLIMLIQKFVLRQAKVVTPPSVYLKKLIMKTYGIKEERAIVNYNAAEGAEVVPLPSKRHPHQIATTARLVAWKGVDGIIEATAVLKKEFPDVRFMVAGEGPELNRLKKLAEQLGVIDQVVFMGNISRAETWQLRKNSEVYVLNSTYEGLPHTVLTSFAAEIPVVATDISGTNEAAYHEKTALLVKPGDSDALAKAIKKIFLDPELGNQIVANGRKILEEKFSWGAHVKILNQIFQSVIIKPRN